MESNTEQNLKWKTPRGTAATKAKKKYNEKAYDRIEITVPKGMKARIKEITKEQGFNSQNSYIAEAIKEKYLRDTGKELEWISEKE